MDNKVINRLNYLITREYVEYASNKSYMERHFRNFRRLKDLSKDIRALKGTNIVEATFTHLHLEGKSVVDLESMVLPIITMEIQKEYYLYCTPLDFRLISYKDGLVIHKLGGIVGSSPHKIKVNSQDVIRTLLKDMNRIIPNFATNHNDNTEEFLKLIGILYNARLKIK